MGNKQKPQETAQATTSNSCVKYSSDALSTSKALSKFGLHRDVIRAILVDDEYTIDEAEKSIQHYIDTFEN